MVSFLYQQVQKLVFMKTLDEHIKISAVIKMFSTTLIGKKS